MTLRQRLWKPSAIVFVSSACIMILELVASRLIAPRLGVSLYTWTSVIGVILGGISLGNYVGGRLADRYASSGLLGIVFALASLGSLSILLLISVMHDVRLPPSVPLIAWVVAYIAAVFFVPSTVLGCVSPIVVKLGLTDLARTGATVGRIYAWSSVGSIVGTFATGFWLISWFGTKTIVVLVAALLMLLALWFLTDTSRTRAIVRTAVALALFWGGIGLLGVAGHLDRECAQETNYFCIKVHDTEREGRPIRELVLDRLVHSYSDLEDPTHLVYGYEQTYAEVVRPLMASKPGLSALFIGGGGYTFPRYLEAALPESQLVVAEIDPGVTQIATQLLGLAGDTRIETHNLDARLHLVRERATQAYDLVFGDAFNDYSVPFHLTTLEFDRLVADALRDDGLYVVNIVDGGRRGRFLRAYVHTLEQVFAHVAVIPSSVNWRESSRMTFVVVAAKGVLDLSHLSAGSGPLSTEEWTDYVAQAPPTLLTDDHVPVDNLLAPVFADSARG